MTRLPAEMNTAVHRLSDSKHRTRYKTSLGRFSERGQKEGNFKMRRILVLLVITTFLFISAEQIFAESMTSVRGRVFDHSGRPVAVALVNFTIRHETGAVVAVTTKSAKTDENGRYVIERLPVGCGSGKANAKCCGTDSQRVCLDGQTINVVNFRLH